MVNYPLSHAATFEDYIISHIWIFILLFTIPMLCASHKAYSQGKSENFDFYLKAYAGPLLSKNELESTFNPKVSLCFGGYFTARYNFSRFGISAGIGTESFSFKEKLEFNIIPAEIGNSVLSMNYLIVGIPILGNYSISDRLDIYGGLNIIWANWMSLGYAVSGPQYSELVVNRSNNIPNWQFTQEAMLGLNYKVSQRFLIGFNIAKSLENIQGMGVEMEFSTPEEEPIVVSGRFDHSWIRVNLELIFRLNK